MFFIKFYVLVVDEIDIRGPKLVFDHFVVVKILKIFHKDQPRVLEEGPMCEPKAVKPAQPTEDSQCPIGWSTPCR